MDDNTQGLIRRIRPLHTAAKVLDVVAIVSAIGGIFTGIAIAHHTEPIVRGGAPAATTNRGPRPVWR